MTERDEERDEELDEELEKEVHHGTNEQIAFDVESESEKEDFTPEPPRERTPRRSAPRPEIILATSGATMYDDGEYTETDATDIINN